MIPDLVIAVVVALITSLVVCRALISSGPLDAPDEDRKNHPKPTPTSGGVGIAAGFAAAMATLAPFSSVLRQQIGAPGAQPILVAALLAYPLAVVGFIDDVKYLRARFKFVIYAVLSLAAAWFLGAVAEIRVGDISVLLPPVIALGGTALWVFTMINAVNFMDGANGLSMGSVAIGFLALVALALVNGVDSVVVMGLGCAGALVGFLAWNFPSGRLFAGDSGALFAGALASFASLILIAESDVSPLLAPIVFFPLLADALLTLLDRVGRRCSILDGHLEHVYQIAILWGWSHKRVALTYWGAMALCGGVAFGVALDRSHVAPLVALAGLAATALLVDREVRRRARAKGILG